jgi:type IV pilus assembly protein PilA
MIVVVIIGLLAALAIPALSRVKTSARAGRLVSGLRTFAQAFETYATAHGTWPGDGTPSVVPAGMSGDFSTAKWTAETSVGGQWDRDYQQFGFTAGISVYRPTAGTATMLEIDRKIDDGDIATGNFRARTDGYILILEPRTRRGAQRAAARVARTAFCRCRRFSAWSNTMARG